SLELVLNSGIGTTNATLAQYFNHFMRSKESLYPEDCVQSTAAETAMDNAKAQLQNDTLNTTSPQTYNRFNAADEPMYIFDRSIWKQKDGFQFQYFKPLPYLHNNKDDDYGIFFVGVSGTNWKEFDQGLYVPEFWLSCIFTMKYVHFFFHAVLNVGDVLAGAIQISVSYTEWIELLDEVTEIEKDLDNSKRKKAHKKPLTDLEKQSKHRRLLAIHETMLRLAPNNDVHHFFVGYEYKVLEVFDKAIDHFSHTIHIDPTYIDAYLGLSDAYLQSRSYRHKRNPDDVSEAEHVLRIAYRLNPLHPQVKFKLASILQESGQDALAQTVRNSEPLPNVEESKQFKSEGTQRQQSEKINQNINFIKPRVQY
ncbi:hypothetical protein RFI_26464, partial [Reticulomyxa filosa]